jgi:hypothetical protein
LYLYYTENSARKRLRNIFKAQTETESSELETWQEAAVEDDKANSLPKYKAESRLLPSGRYQLLRVGII